MISFLNDRLWLRCSSTSLVVTLLYCVSLIQAEDAIIAETNFKEQAFTNDLIPILQQQCQDCHNADSLEGGLDLTRFTSFSDAMSERTTWRRIFDVVEAGQMPLQDSGYELSENERAIILAGIRFLMTKEEPQLGAMDPGKPVLRRLTRLEYNNSVRDLFNLPYDIFAFSERLQISDKDYFLAAEDTLGDVVRTSIREYGQKYDVLLPSSGLPGDNRAEYGFANRGDSLNTSPLLLEKYLQLASEIASSERMLRDSKIYQELLNVRLPKEQNQQAGTSGKLAAHQVTDAVAQFAPNENLTHHAEGNDTWKGAFVEELALAHSQGHGGVIDIDQSLNNQTVPGKGGLIKVRVGQQIFTMNPNVDLWLASFGTAEETSGSLLLTNKIKNDKLFELTFGSENERELQVQHLGVCVLARRNQSGQVILSAVLADEKELVRKATIDTTTGNTFYSFVAPPGNAIKRLRVDGSGYSGEYVLVDDIGIILKPIDLDLGNYETRETPESEPASSRAPLPEIKQIVPVVPKPLDQRVEEFMRRAFRRAISDEELAECLTNIQNWTVELGDQQLALRRFVQSVLSSPNFLFISEPKTSDFAKVRRLNAYELANRMSYFLWSAPPDGELLEVAESGALLDDYTLRQQVQRMLGLRARSRELSESFAVQWLRIDQLYSAKPDREQFKGFYSGPQGKSTMHGAMMTEALLLFESVLVENRSVLDLVDPDFTWLNSKLAAHYELEKDYQESYERAQSAGMIPGGVDAKQVDQYWIRCRLPSRDRGGMMTMAGPLTLTSLPYRTSPIKRGAWLLETVFNRPPAEPKVAFVLEESSDSHEEVSGLSVRQLFERHRTDPNCLGCHSRIDPPGFALERFDAIGKWRERDGDELVDATGTWNAVPFDGPAKFKDALRANEAEFVRGFTEHLLSYALGRKLEYFDMPTVDSIVAKSSHDHYRFSEIVQEIVLSYPFQNIRNGDR